MGCVDTSDGFVIELVFEKFDHILHTHTDHHMERRCLRLGSERGLHLAVESTGQRIQETSVDWDLNPDCLLRLRDKYCLAHIHTLHCGTEWAVIEHICHNCFTWI